MSENEIKNSTSIDADTEKDAALGRKIADDAKRGLHAVEAGVVEGARVLEKAIVEGARKVGDAIVIGYTQEDR